MPEIKRRGREPKDQRPIVVDDFVYNDPENTVHENPVQSDTPDEAIRKLHGMQADSPAEPAESIGSGDSSAEDYLGRKDASAQPWVSSSGVILDGARRQPVDTKGRRPRREHRGLRAFALTLITIVLILFIAAYIFHRIDPGLPFLGKPEALISRVVSPVQTFFSRVTDTAVGYIRSREISDDLERKYTEAVARNEQLTYKKVLADELKSELSQYTVLSDEVRNIENLNPITCKIIGRSDTNYFSTYTIDKGSADGITEKMPVTYEYSLVGYIESVDEHRSVVRTIVDSNVSIGVVIQSNSRDQGTLSGTIGIDGTAMCRVHLVEKTELPRPGDQVVTSGIGMDFLDGIPIGLITESTRGSKDNRDYIVVQPHVDFSTLDHVVVLRYKTAGSMSQGVNRPAGSNPPAEDNPAEEDALPDDSGLSDDNERMDYNEYADDDLIGDMTFAVAADDGGADAGIESEGGDADADPEETW